MTTIEEATSSDVPGRLATPSSFREGNAAPSRRPEVGDQSGAVENMAPGSSAPHVDSIYTPEGWNFDWMVGMEMNDFSVLSSYLPHRDLH